MNDCYCQSSPSRVSVERMKMHQPDGALSTCLVLPLSMEVSARPQQNSSFSAKAFGQYQVHREELANNGGIRGKETDSLNGRVEAAQGRTPSLSHSSSVFFASLSSRAFSLISCNGYTNPNYFSMPSDTQHPYVCSVIVRKHFYKPLYCVVWT